MKITVIAATTNEDGGVSGAFTIENLEQLAKTALGVRIIEDFDNSKDVGCITSAHVNKNGQLIIETDMNVDPRSRYIVPGFSVGVRHQDRGMEDIKSVAYGLIDNPQDQSLPKIN